jgi:hypothetical protein
MEPPARRTGWETRAIKAHGLVFMVFASSPSANAITSMTAMKTQAKVIASRRFILSLSKKLAITHTISGVRLQTMPTVDTLKYFKLMKEMKMEKAAWVLRKSKEGRLARSTESIRVFFKFVLIRANIIREAIIPRMNVN